MGGWTGKLTGPLFSLGHVCMTPGVQGVIAEINAPELLRRHITGDWGDMDDDDKQTNDEAVQAGDARVFSAYTTPAGRIWIITESDRSVTTLLLPEEY